jgi:hypothetical protein
MKNTQLDDTSQDFQGNIGLPDTSSQLKLGQNRIVYTVSGKFFIP